ncbi:hypothetical protein [Clostridium sp.]|uniref:P-type ATPase n=1 Tax=Clostridium sp. TaxID=1506 RepID=UPI0039958576
MNRWYNLSWSRIVESLNSDSKRGLSFKQLEISMRSSGKNNLNLKGKSEKSNFRLILEETSFLLVFIIVILFFLKSYIEGTLLLVLLIFRIYIFFKNKKKKLAEVDVINNLNYTDVWVMRGGIRDFVKAEDLVIGDIVLLKNGNLVPADIRIIEAENLKINERNILGEEFISLKNSARLDGEINSLKEVYNMAFRGTRIVSGEGKGIVVSIGNKTKLGNIVKYFDLYNKKSKVVESKIDEFKKKLNIYGIALSLIVFFIYYVVKIETIKILGIYSLFIVGTFNFLDMFKFLTIKKNIEGFKRKGISSLKEEYLKTFDNINVLFVDKLAAITEEKMNVKTIYTNNEINEKGKINTNEINNERLMSIAVLCNNSKYNKAMDSYSGDLKEGATLKFASENGVFKSALEAKNKRLFEVVNDGYKEIKTTVNRVNNKYRANIRGSLDEILARSSYIMIDGIEKTLDNETIENIKKIDFNFENTGYVTEAFAYRSFNYEPTEDENIESNLVFVGLIGYENPKKENVEEIIDEIKKRNIVPILFTDDNKITAYRIGKEVGLVSNMSEVISGVELLSLGKDEIIEVLSRVKVFCRINPDIRNKIIEIFVENKYKICSTGENLSHIPSVLLSDVSVAKGNNVAALIKTLSTVSIGDNILKNIIYLYDECKKYKYNLEKTLNLMKNILIVEIVVVLFLELILKTSLRYWVLLFNFLFIPILFSLSIISYKNIERKVLDLGEFISNKWRVLKLR